MRGKFSCKSRNGEAESEKVKEPRLSGAYIRCLVKELTSSRTKGSSSSKEPENSEGEGCSSNQNLTGMGDGFSDHKQEKSPAQHKKQVRRRLHTTRPYQERLLNMAEARREIVTALKFHRAAMKQANEKQLQQQRDLESEPAGKSLAPLSNRLLLDQEAKSKLKNPRIYSSNSSTSSNFPSKNYSYAPDTYSPFSWPVPMIAPAPRVQESVNLALPSQALGLNLNLQDFNLLDIPFHGINKPSSASTSFSHAPGEIPCMMATPSMVTAEVSECGDSGMHPAMDDKDMAEIRSIGEQHEMEWSDTMNFVTSAWWFRFFKEIKPLDEKTVSPFDEYMDMPTWLNANEICLQHLNDCCSDDCLQNPALPCMDLEEIEGKDVDWLA